MINKICDYLHKVYSNSPFPMKSISQSQGSPGHQGVATESGSPCHSCLAVGPPSGTASWLCCAFQLPPSLHVDLWSSWVYFARSAYLLSIQRVFPLPWLLMMQSVCTWSFQHGLSALSFLLVCTGSSKDQICFTDFFFSFQVSSALLCSDPIVCPDAQVSFRNLLASGP